MASENLQTASHACVFIFKFINMIVTEQQDKVLQKYTQLKMYAAFSKHVHDMQM